MKETSSNPDKMAAYVEESMLTASVLAIEFKNYEDVKRSLIIPISLQNGSLEYIALLPEADAGRVFRFPFESILTAGMYDLNGLEFLKLVKNHKGIFNSIL